MRCALTGGIACGKSLFAKFLAELGVRFLDADDVVHELEAPDGAAVPAIRARFGTGILTPDGAVDRPALAARVFADPAARADLEAMLFPKVRERLLRFCDEAREHPCLAIIPLLFESHWEKDYDIIAALVSPREMQIDRMIRTRGMTREAAEARIVAQMPVVEKAARAHYVITNETSPEALRLEAERFVVWLKAKTSEKSHG